MTVNAPATCPPKATKSTEPGVTSNTISGAVLDLGGAIGSVLSGALGGNGGSTASRAGPSGATRTALAAGETGAAAAAGGTRWNVWAALSQASVGYGFQPLQSGGDVRVALGGLDYSFDNQVVLGVAVTDERTRVTTSFNGGRISANGNTIAPYLGWRINSNWALDASVGMGRTNISIVDNSVAGGITGANRDARTLASAGLSYSRAAGRWLLSGRGGLSTAEDRFSSFTLSTGKFVDASTARTSQLRLGAQAMYNAGSVVPFFGVTYTNDLERPNQNPVAGQAAANDRDGWQLRAGLNFRSSGALYGSVQLTSEVGRSQIKNDQILFLAGFRF